MLLKPLFGPEGRPPATPQHYYNTICYIPKKIHLNVDKCDDVRVNVMLFSPVSSLVPNISDIYLPPYLIIESRKGGAGAPRSRAK